MVIAQAPIAGVEADARLGLMLAADTDGAFTRHYHELGEDGGEEPALNVFVRDGAAIRRFWGAELAGPAPTRGGNRAPRQVRCRCGRAAT